jgi:hypothetical protein
MTGENKVNTVFELPTITELDSLGFGSLSTTSQQQQQQQQQQVLQKNQRRFINLKTGLPEEEVVTKLTTEIRQFNKLAPSEDRD